ncbi:MAG: ABC transporter substrate-binding protein, partial [Anaerolineales bacterium]|nr:ABC transporter substrate-binding protein [Anaerolineales bacterium]
MQGVPPGKYPQQYELAEFESLTGAKMEFSDRGFIDPLLTEIYGEIPTNVRERLPEEPLVVVPYYEIGKYGGQLEGLSGGPESGNSEYLSWRHANLVRFADDLTTIVPNVAKDYSISDDYREFTFTLRKGHKWSDGKPFTTADVAFWWEDIILNKELTPSVPSYWVFGGEPMQVEIIDEITFKIKTVAPAPGLMPWLAVSWILPAAPRHVLEKKHLKYNPDINKEAQENGFPTWVEYFYTYYGEWQDSVHRWKEGIPKLEAWIVVEETPQYQLAVANPYYHAVDTAGQQLPYVDRSRESYSEDDQIIELKLINGEIDQKSQWTSFSSVPVYKQHEERGDYKVYLAQAASDGPTVGFNCTHKDPVLRQIFSNPKFSYAMSIAINRKEINKVTCFGECEEISTGVPIHPSASFAKPEWYTYATEYDPEKADQILDELGLDKRDSDGWRLRPDGKRLVIFVQGFESDTMNLVKSYWEAVGVKVEMKEVSLEAYRALASNNDHDLAVITSGATLEISFLSYQNRFYPPFGDPVLEPICGASYLEWYNSGGQKGEEPPPDMKRLFELTEKFKTLNPGTEEYKKVGQEIGDIHMRNLFLIGILGPSPEVIIVKNRLGNFFPLKIVGWEFYRMYPVRPDQWYLKY